MSSFSRKFVVIIVQILLTFKGFVSGGPVRRFNLDARLYEHFQFDSRYIQFSRTNPEEWANFKTLTEARNFTAASMLCTLGPGAWLLYPEADYDMGNKQSYYLIIGEHCIRSDDIASMQPLGKMDEVFDDDFVLFSKPNFGGKATLLEGEGSGEAQSLLFSTDEDFELSGGSAKYCVQPDDDLGYCLIPDLKSSLKIEGSATIKINCSDDTAKENTITVHDCYPNGVHEIFTDADFSVDKLKEVCSGGGDPFSKAKFTIVMDMWAKRLGKDYEGPRPDYRHPKDALKLNIIWNVIDTFNAICPTVDVVYTYLIGSMFEIHLKNAWKMEETPEIIKGPANDSVTEEIESWAMVYKWTDFCKSVVRELPVLFPTCRTSDKKFRDTEMSSNIGDEWYTIVNGYEYDTVIEQVWLMINTFIPRCATQQDYGTNDWNDMVIMFNKLYLEPLKEAWADPQDWQRVYDAVFHGYDLREKHQHVLDCLRFALESSPAYDPIGRPKEFKNYITYKYLVPMFGEIISKNTGGKGKDDTKKSKRAAKVSKGKRETAGGNGIEELDPGRPEVPTNSDLTGELEHIMGKREISTYSSEARKEKRATPKKSKMFSGK